MGTEAPVSLVDELSQAFDAGDGSGGQDAIDTTAGDAGATDGVDAGQPETDAATESAAAARARDERGRFAKVAEGEQPAGKPEHPADAAAPGAENPAPAQASAEPVDLPPSTWTPEAKAAYQALPPVVRREIKKREADFQRGINQYKELAQHGDVMQRAIQPYMPMIQSEGGDPVKSVSQLLNTAYRLRTGSPAERGQMVMAIAQQFGADLSPWMQGQPQGEQSTIDQRAIQAYVQQLVAQQTAPLQQYQQSMLTAKQQQEQAAAAQTQQQIEQFRTAVNAQGQPEHVYFDNVRPLMASLIESGSANTLDDAYAMACRAHPEVAKAVAAEQQQRAEAQRLAEAKKKAEGARRAATANVTGQGGVGVADTSKSSLRDELTAQFERTAAV